MILMGFLKIYFTFSLERNQTYLSADQTPQSNIIFIIK